jgi:hypothetical protein
LNFLKFNKKKINRKETKTKKETEKKQKQKTEINVKWADQAGPYRARGKALQNLNQQLHVFFFNFSRLLVVLAARYSFLFYFENQFSDG